MRRIRIQAGGVVVTAVLRDTPTADAVWAALPFSAAARTWGDEVYFSTPVSADLEPDATDVVRSGELAFWTQGRAIAIGFGPTPVSRGNEIRLADRTNLFADAECDVRTLKAVRDGDAVSVERAG